MRTPGRRRYNACKQTRGTSLRNLYITELRRCSKITLQPQTCCEIVGCRAQCWNYTFIHSYLFTKANLDQEMLAPTTRVQVTSVLLEFPVYKVNSHWHILRPEQNQTLKIHERKKRKTGNRFVFFSVHLSKLN